MDRNYVLGFGDRQLEKKLLSLDNVSIVENLLYNSSEELRRLQSLKKAGKLDFGSQISSEELKVLAPKIFGEVDNFLDVRLDKAPQFGYYNLFGFDKQSLFNLGMYGILSSLAINSAVQSIQRDMNHLVCSLLWASLGLGLRWRESFLKEFCYDQVFNKITLEKVARANLIPLFAHEYSHHVQHEKGFLQDGCSAFLEGHARGIGRHLSQEYGKKEGNEAFLFWELDRNVSGLKSTYPWMCRIVGKYPVKNLLEIETESYINDSNPSAHALGNTFFSIYETLYGKDIYKDVINGRFEFA